MKKVHRENAQEFSEVEGARKGKKFGQLYLGSLELGSLAREIREGMRFQFLNSSFNIYKFKYMSGI